MHDPLLTLAIRPMLDPIDAQSAWYVLLIPLALGVSMAYKAIRVGNLKNYPKQVLMMTAQIIIGIVFLGMISFVILEKILPLIAPMPGT